MGLEIDAERTLSSREKSVALGLMSVSVVGLTLQGAAIKHLSDDFGAATLLVYRSAAIVALLLPFCILRGRRAWWPSDLSRHMLRSIYGFGTLIFYFYAISALPLADAVALSFTRPIWAIVISAIVLKEAITGRKLSATALGIVGIVLIAQPTGTIEPATFAALASAIFAGLSIVAIRQLAQRDPVEKIILYFAVFTGLFALPLAWLDWRTPQDHAEIGWLVASALTGLAGQVGMAMAARRAPIGLIVPMDFVRVPAAALAGFIFFGDLPTSGLVAGSVVVLAATALAATGGRRGGGK